MLYQLNRLLAVPELASQYEERLTKLGG